MATTNTVKARIQVASNTEAKWMESDPVGLAGEIMFTSGDSPKIKVGDGTSKWSELPYLHTESEIAGLGLTPYRALASSSDGNIAASDITSTELGYLDGVTSNVQTQLNGKAASSHTHDSRYYTESEMDTKLSNKVSNTSDGVSAAINKLGTDETTPTDADYIVSQYAGGGTTNTTYLRRPLSALWTWIKGKLATVATSGSYTDLSNKPTIPTVNNPTITITQAGTTKGTFTLNQSGNATIALTDSNTTYGTVTTSANGLMSSSDKSKLDGIASNANNYTHPTTSGNKHIPSGGSSGQILRWSADGTATWGSDNNTTYSAATTSANGLMSAADKTKLNNTNVAFATCSTAAATAAKVATITGDTNWTLTVGAIICVKYTYTNTASNCTLNVNDTGAKRFYWDATVYTGKGEPICGKANRYHYYFYDGNYWVWMGASVDLNATYSNATLGSGYGTCTTAADTTAKVATLGSYSLVTGGKPTIKFSYDVPASATLNINSKGAKPIYYGGSAITADIIAAGDIVTFVYDGSKYHVIAIDKMSKVTQTIEDSSTSVPSGAAVTKKLSSYLEFEVLSTIS